MNAWNKKMLALSVALLSVLTFGASAIGAEGAEGAPDTGRSADSPSHPVSDNGDHKAKRHGKGHFIFTESAKLFGMECSALAESLKSGKSLADIAKEKKGWTEDQYVQKLAEAAGSRIDKGVAEGRFTQEQARQLKSGLPAMLKAKVTEKGPFTGHHHPHRKPADQNG
ncbi:hypothetical protein [Paenibacillus sabinae]|uniref:Uncharacterized protein n=1 Tax=Paenibacillus sabinae T27 TaxID=1268072 RepID=X4ZZW9_9BACL|nr:hypothetical protein [Paenibacillus sabinae]AHV97184.1 hypothetical protein PSAB_11280 [Paenibacillus sabinae T27]